MIKFRRQGLIIILDGQDFLVLVYCYQPLAIDPKTDIRQIFVEIKNDFKKDKKYVSGSIKDRDK